MIQPERICVAANSNRGAFCVLFEAESMAKGAVAVRAPPPHQSDTCICIFIYLVWEERRG